MGNKVAGQLVKRGMNKSALGLEPTNPLNASVNRLQTNQTISARNKHKLVKIIKNLSWKTTRIITQIVTRHVHVQLRRHRHLMGLEDEITCKNCKEENETTEHFLTRCPLYAVQRYQIFGKSEMRIEEMRKEPL